MKNSLIVSKASALCGKARLFIENELAKSELEGIMPCHGDLLHFVLKEPGISVSALARTTHRSKSTVSKLGDKLVSLGYIRKERSSSDPRVIELYPTDKCRQIEESFEAISARLCTKVASKLDGSESAELERLLDKACLGFED